MGATSVNTGHLWFDQAALVPSYDADGNLLSDGRWTYTWDAENRMTKMVTTTAATDAGHPYTKLEFKYDFLGRRTERAIWYKGTASSPTFKSRARWMYVGWNPVIEFSSNAGGTSLTRKLEFTWGNHLSGSMEGAGGVGGLLMQRTVSDGKLRRPAYDGNGNITAWALKGSGGTANPNMEQLRTEYDAFGNIVVSEGTLNSEFGFSTKIRDPYTGLSYYGYRYYDPVTGRWPSRDPIGERGGMNLYGFVGNDGANVTDYLGMKECHEIADPANRSKCCCEKFPNQGRNARGSSELRSCCQKGGKLMPFYEAVGLSEEECSERRQEEMSWLYETATVLETLTAARAVPAFVGGYRLIAGAESLIWADNALGVAGEAAVGAVAGRWFSNPFHDWASKGVCNQKVCSADKDKIKKMRKEILGE